MKLETAIGRIRALYSKPNSTFSSHAEVENTWQKALDDFDSAMEHETDPATLEACILADENWDIHVDGRLRLLDKAKSLGVSSNAFLMDYYRYRAFILDPGPEKDEAFQSLDLLMKG